MQILTLILILFVLVILIIIASIYNRLITAQKNTNEAWSDIDVQLKRRHDLIPALIETVKGYANHEKELFERIATDRSAAMAITNKDVVNLSALETTLSADVQSLLLLSEAYPELKANEQFLKLQIDLSETEDQIASSRRIYNSNTADYNTLLALFPINIVAKFFHFNVAKFFQAAEGDKALPTV